MTNSSEIAEIVSRREALLRATVGLEDALAGPVGDGETWRLRVAMAVDHAVARVEEHVAQTEGPGSILDDVLQLAPRLSRRIDQMLHDHERLQKSGHTLSVSVAELEQLTGDELKERAIEVRNEAVDMMGQITRHRQRGSDLIYEAYNVDLGNSA